MDVVFFQSYTREPAGLGPAHRKGRSFQFPVRCLYVLPVLLSLQHGQRELGSRAGVGTGGGVQVWPVPQVLPVEVQPCQTSGQWARRVLEQRLIAWLIYWIGWLLGWFIDWTLIPWLVYWLNAMERERDRDRDRDRDFKKKLWVISITKYMYYFTPSSRSAQATRINKRKENLKS